MYIDTTPEDGIWFCEHGRIVFSLKLTRTGNVILIASGDAYCHKKFGTELDPISCPGLSPSGEGSRHQQGIYREELWPKEELIIFHSPYSPETLIACKLKNGYHETKLFEVNPIPGRQFSLRVSLPNGASEEHLFYEVIADGKPRGLFLEKE